MPRRSRRARRTGRAVMVLGIEPHYDKITTPAWQHREKEVYKDLTALLNVTLLDDDKPTGNQPTMDNVMKAMTQKRFDYVTGQGHGDKYKFKGHDNEGIFETDVPDSFFHKIKKIKIVHLVSCTTGKGLGRDFVKKKKCAAFFGYDDLVAWDPCPAKVFFACDSKIDLALAKGKTAAEAYEAAKKVFESEARKLDREGADNRPATLRMLFKHLCAPSRSRVFGSKSARLYRPAR